MPESPNPWSRPPTHVRVYVWLGLLLAGTAGVWLLARAFPERSLSDYDEARFINLVVIMAMASSAIVFSRRFTLRETARNIAIWIAVAAVLVAGYLYRDVFDDFQTRLQTAFLPSDPVALAGRTVVLSENEDGSFYITGEVDGTRVLFLIDTGATGIVLSPADARRVGIDVDSLNYSGESATANGIGHGAPYTVKNLSAGPIHFSDIDVSVNRVPMASSLLGMSFLRRMKSFEIKDRKLYLHW
jgi:aspartyl protease family protein